MPQQKNQKKTVLIVGGSFAGLTAAKTLGSKFNIIIVDRKSFFEFTPSFPFTLTDPNYIDKITADIQNFANKYKCQFVRGTLVELYSNRAQIKISEIEIQTIAFDYCIISTGSNYASQIKSGQEAQTVEQRKEQIKQLIERLDKGQKCLVVGGGAVGVEMAGVVKDQFKKLQVDLWSKPSELLTQLPKKGRKLAHEFLTKLGVNISYNKEVTILPEQEYDYIFDCRGNVYSPSFMNTGEFQQYVDNKGRIIVDDYNRFEFHHHIYCIGDACISPNNEPKMGYNAMIQGQYAADNINKTENKSKSLKKMVGFANMFNISVSKKQAIMCMGENSAFQSCMNHNSKRSVENTICKSFKGSTWYSGVSYIQRKFIIFITVMGNCCKSRKQTDKQNEQKQIPNSNQKQVVNV